MGRATWYSYDGLQLTYTYDLFGNLELIGDMSNEGIQTRATKYQYDAIGRPTAVLEKVNGSFKQVESYAYDAKGDLTQTTQYLQFESRANARYGAK